MGIFLWERAYTLTEQHLLDRTPLHEKYCICKAITSAFVLPMVYPHSNISLKKQNRTFSFSKFSLLIQGKTIVKLMNCYYKKSSTAVKTLRNYKYYSYSESLTYLLPLIPFHLKHKPLNSVTHKSYQGTSY